MLYHYDEISLFLDNNQPYLFFASFALDKIVFSLKRSTPESYNIIIINKNAGNLIEITPQGSREDIPDRLDFRLNDQEKARITGSIEIPGTHWSLVNLRNDMLISANLYSYIYSAMLIFTFGAIVIFTMAYMLRRNYREVQRITFELTERNKQILSLNDELEELSITDSLTGLYNRRYFDKHFNKEWNRAIRNQSPICVIILDIDHFKKYNDRYGHQQGDTCLKRVASILASCFSRNTEFVARYGGEEFIAVVNDNLEACKCITSILHQKLQLEHITHEDSELKRISCSIGIACTIPDQSVRSETLIEKADIALYQAKKKGRNQTTEYKKWHEH